MIMYVFYLRISQPLSLAAGSQPLSLALNLLNSQAKKEWGGLVRSYYKKRYQLLFSMAADALDKGYAWDQRDYTTRLLSEVELPWQTNTSTFPIKPEADPIATSQHMIKKYGGSASTNLSL